MENNQNMVKNNNKVIVILAIVIILLLVVICALGMILANGEYKEYKQENDVQDKVDDYIDDLIDDDNDEYDVDIEILSMNEPSIISLSPNHHLYITGDMNLTFKEEDFRVVGLVGYCLGDKNEKYMIYGPASEVGMSFNNGDTSYELVETIGDKDGDVRYPDGSKKNSGDVDWDNVKIKSCKIEKLYTVYNKNGKTITSYIETNYEKNFD